ncbi:hypothetical protein [Ruminococcus sp.]|nr:hypothetical protein [Ruminococcus sp.]
MVQTIWAFIKTIYQIFTTNIITVIIGIMALISIIIPIKRRKTRI